MSDQLASKARLGQWAQATRAAIELLRGASQLEEVARACVRVRYYRTMVVVADLSECQHLLGLRQLREQPPRNWIIVVATNTELEAREVVFTHGGDACLPKPFQFSDLLFRLESLSHLERRA